MNKKTNDIIKKVLLGLAIFSFVITFIEGCLYYDDIENELFRFLIIIQNSIKAFAFRTDISIEDMLGDIVTHPGLFRQIIGYAYGVACFTAPYCTLTFCYKIITKLLKINLFISKRKKYRHIIIFGYNDEVKALLADKEYISNNKYKIHIVVGDNSAEKDEEYILHNKIELHPVDFLSLSENQISYFLKRIEAELAEDIILFEESSSRNFSLYNLFFSEECRNYLKKNGMKENVKFFCRCEDAGIEQIIQDYHDSYVLSDICNEFCSDLEIISVPELRIRKMLEKNPLHSYYLNSGVRDMNEWHLHILIIGFGKLGQQLLLQTMSQGVTGSRNNIIIDVVDYDVEKKKSIFVNTFSDEYMEFHDNDYIISSDKADGLLKIRFRNMDIRYQQFEKLLQNLGEVGAFTYVAICVEDPDTTLHCMSKINRYIRSCDRDNKLICDNVCLGVRMDFDKRMEKYVTENNKTYKNVFAIEATSNAISLEGLLNDKVDRKAKDFNYIYNTININPDSGFKNVEEDRYNLWKKMSLFRRNSSRALAEHETVKQLLIKDVSKEDMEKWFGENGELLEYRAGNWFYKTNEDDFVKVQSDIEKYPVVSEFSRMEHRRWCYFMASARWKDTDKPDKSDIFLENPCMATWENLTLHRPKYCVYDLIPLLMKYKDIKEK